MYALLGVQAAAPTVFCGDAPVHAADKAHYFYAVLVQLELCAGNQRALQYWSLVRRQQVIHKSVGQSLALSRQVESALTWSQERLQATARKYIA